MMPVGVLTDCSCVLIGGLLGTVLGSRFAPALREKLTMVLGFDSMAIGINSIVKANQMTPVVIAVIFGTLLGELLHLEEHITHVFGAVTRKLPHDEANFDMERYITVVVLFCASGFGIYGVLVEGMSGSPAVLQSKAVLDLCTAAVFAVTLGVAVAVIALPMLAVMLALFFAAGAIAPFVTPEMLQDFISCGGVLTIVAGMRVSGIKQYPIANMIPALLLVLCGATAAKIRTAVENAEGYQPGHPEIVEVTPFQKAVETARDRAVPGDVVTLSPACAAFDQFKNFAERGKTFKTIVNGWQE